MTEHAHAFEKQRFGALQYGPSLGTDAVFKVVTLSPSLKPNVFPYAIQTAMALFFNCLPSEFGTELDRRAERVSCQTREVLS